jgi:hypothetical protein
MKRDVTLTFILRVLHRWLYQSCSSEGDTFDFELIQPIVPDFKIFHSFYSGVC